MKSILRYAAYIAVAAALLAQPAWAWHQHQDWQDGWYQPRHHLRYQPGHYVWHQPRHHVWHQARHHLRSQPRHYVWYQPKLPPPQEWYQLQEPVWYPPGAMPGTSPSAIPGTSRGATSCITPGMTIITPGTIAGLLTTRRSTPPPRPAATPVSTT